MLSQISFPGLDVTAAELYFAALQTGTAHLDLKKKKKKHHRFYQTKIWPWQDPQCAALVSFLLSSYLV